MLITPISRNTASATRVVVAAVARLTAPMVAAGAVAKKWLLEKYGTTFRGCMTQVGELPLRLSRGTMCPTTRFLPRWLMSQSLEAYMDALRKSGDSCGARLRVSASGVPVGLGEPLFDKMDADIAYAMMGINAVKGVEIGAGFASVAQRGTTHGDALTPHGFAATTLEVCWAVSPQGKTWRCHCHQAYQFHPHPARVD
jgi:chorismate synthase